MKTVKLIFIVWATLLVSVFAQANERIQIELDEHFRRGGVIKLKQEIKNIYPNIRLNRMEILKVRLVAKSKHGGGFAELMVNNRPQESSGIDGSPREFRSNLPRTFHRIVLQHLGRRSTGNWQLHIDGNVKVKKVVVVISEKNGNGRQPPRGRVFTKVLGGDKATKVGNSAKTFHIREKTQSIILKGTKRRLTILSAVVEYRNGRTESLPELEGQLKSGRTKSASLGGRNIDSIRIVSKTLNPFGSRGKYEISAKVYR